jgi:hypothetical protein
MTRCPSAARRLETNRARPPRWLNRPLTARELGGSNRCVDRCCHSGGFFGDVAGISFWILRVCLQVYPHPTPD